MAEPLEVLPPPMRDALPVPPHQGEGVAASPQKMAAVWDWAPAWTVAELYSFLGPVSYYQHFVKDFASMANTMHCLIEKGSGFAWMDA